MKAVRAHRQQLFSRVQMASLWCAAGVDLNYAWKQTKGAPSLAASAKECPLPSHRLWLESLAELHAQGAPTQDVLESFLRQLALETETDYQAHCRTLPARLNVGLLLVFFPPTMLLFLLPLLFQFLNEF